MELDPKRKVPIPFWGLCVLFVFIGLGWMTASFLVGKIADEEFAKVVSELGIRIFGALFVGSSAGIIIQLYLKHALGETPRAILERSGIKEIYPSRLSAAPEFLRLVQNRRIKKIYIMGISLRDFLTGAGSLREVWQAIRQRLEDEQKINLAEKDRLHVRLLLLDPRSSEGRCRHDIEKNTIGRTGLPFDVPHGLEEVSQVQQNIFKSNPQKFLQVRLYEHCPFSFIFATETEIFIEQYYYRDHTRRVKLPLIKYLSDTSQHNEILSSFDTIWERAGLGEMLPHHVGTADAIEEARIKNIFRREDRGSLARCEIECLDSTKPGDTVDILAITGKFYISPTFETLRNIASRKDEKESVKVRLALINPVSQQAVLRAIADSSPAERLRETLCSWTWKKHKDSSLYVDVHQTIREIERWKNKGCSFELRLYSGSIACALLLTPNSAFIEQYFYGRSRKFEEGLVLGGEYPVFEYEMSESESEDQIEREILSSTFGVIWNSYSINLDEYESRSEEEEFNQNLTALLEELGCV